MKVAIPKIGSTFSDPILNIMVVVDRVLVFGDHVVAAVVRSEYPPNGRGLGEEITRWPLGYAPAEHTVVELPTELLMSHVNVSGPGGAISGILSSIVIRESKDLCGTITSSSFIPNTGGEPTPREFCLDHMVGPNITHKTLTEINNHVAEPQGEP